MSSVTHAAWALSCGPQLMTDKLNAPSQEQNIFVVFHDSPTQLINVALLMCLHNGFLKRLLTPQSCGLAFWNVLGNHWRIWLKTKERPCQRTELKTLHDIDVWTCCPRSGDNTWTDLYNLDACIYEKETRVYKRRLKTDKRRGKPWALLYLVTRKCCYKLSKTTTIRIHVGIAKMVLYINMLRNVLVNHNKKLIP